MVITAKFTGTCPTCNKQIEAGEKVEWNKGERAKHIRCTAAAAVAAPASDRQTHCAECGSYLPGGRGAVRRDMSGIQALVCGRCSRLGREDLSFA